MTTRINTRQQIPRGDTISVKLQAITLLAIILIFGLAGCGNGNHICNVSLGSTQGVIFHDNHNHCAYPGLLTLPDGNLLAAYSCESGVGADGNLYGPRIELQTSTDNGASWYPNTPVFFSATVVSLSLLSNGTIFLSTSTDPTLGPGVPTYFIGNIGSGDAVTWSDPVFVSTTGWNWGCWAVSPLVQSANGDLLWPVWCYSDITGGLPGSSTVLISKDGGATWPKQVIVGNAYANRTDYDESAAVVYPNGDIVVIIRHTSSGEADGSWFRAKSTDNGSTWSRPQPVVNNHIVGRPALALLPSGALVLMGRAQIGDSETTAFATSWDEGLSFSRFATLELSGPNHDMYDAMSLRPDGTIGVISTHGTFDEKTVDGDYRDLVNSCPILPLD